MKPVIFFTDAAKDGDDLLATFHLILQAKAAGIIDQNTPVKLVTSDEIPCDANGKQNPQGKYGLRALYLNKYLELLKQQLDLPAEAYPEIIAGPVTTYYSYDEEKKKYYNKSSQSEAFYATEEVEDYYADQPAPESCLLNRDTPNAWIEQVKKATPEGATLVNIAAFNGVTDFLSQLSDEERRKFTLFNMGYNLPYSKNSELQEIIKNPNTLPYNARSTDPTKAVQAAQEMVKIDNLHVASGTTRSLPKYDQNSWLSSFTEIMSRAYLLLTLRYSDELLLPVTAFIKHSKYKGFWPHDVVPSLMMVIEQGAWGSMGLPPLKKEMLFTQIERVPATNLQLRMINNTGVLIDSTPASEIRSDLADQAIGHQSQLFTYGKEIDVVFFTSLLHFIAIQALPKEQQEAQRGLLNHYSIILRLKSNLYDLKQDPETNKEKIVQLEQQVKSTWTTVSFMELQQQLSLLTIENLKDEIQYILGSESNTFSLHQFTPEQAKSLNLLITQILDWSTEKDINKTLLNENMLQWIKAVAEYMQVTQKPLSSAMLSDLKAALQKITPTTNLTPLTTALFYRLRAEAMPTDTALNLLKQNGAFDVEFKRTGNSLIYSELSLGGNLSIVFPRGIHGISEEFKDLLTLKNHSEANKLAFKLHLAIHDAGKGDVIKSAVRKNKEGIYFVRLPDNTYYKFEPTVMFYDQPDKSLVKKPYNEIEPSDEQHFTEATAHVDHDAALEVYGAVGGAVKGCSATEFLIWDGIAPEDANKEAISICDELITLCNEMNIAQTIQGEIPFAGIKKGLDLFFAAYKKDPKMAELVFAHHCFDIYGAAQLDSFSSISAGQPEVQLKIELLYKTLVTVAQDHDNPEPSKTAFQLYRKKLAAAIPEILPIENNLENEQKIIAITRVAQMLRCHLFKVKTDAQTKHMSIAEDGVYDQRTRLFVGSIKESFNLLAKSEQQQLIEILNRNDGVENNAAAMVMYGPKLLLTATTGTEFAPQDPTESAVIAERLAPLLRLYTKLYNLQSQRSSQYSVIEIVELALIVERVFTYYKEAAREEKETFANLLFTLQETGKAKEFLAKLPPITETKTKTKQEQFACLQEALKTTAVSFEFSVPVVVPLVTPVTAKPEEIISSEPLKVEPLYEILQTLCDNRSVLNKYELQELLISEVQNTDLTIDQYNELYLNIKNIPELNTHSNPYLDRFFGINNTESWRDTLKILRNQSLEKLFAELENLESDEDKLSLLETAKNLPLFCEHRNNFIIQGAWGRTNSVKLIEEKENEILGQYALHL
ncbi:hypothetical protein [Legionella maioricensis]|uniref:Uncharacterized protein n=1 Tax=Legionella maioricensis TaxID=2896528 RepID=A0A9X2D1S0_9GAMM|nr:hypothetical protein [Legionella maioricensis]MCL9684603.1 hypothetical protein [Legionella maioricensis]MCL9687383.1 hypothetical protein [Legionella maioricensis]